MSDITAEVLSNNHMPGWTVSPIELLLDLRCDVLLDVVFLEGCGRDVDRLLLQLLAHVNVFDDCFGCIACEVVSWR